MYKQIISLATLAFAASAQERYFTAKLKGCKPNGYEDVSGKMIGKHTNGDVAFTEIDINLENELGAAIGAVNVELIWIDLDAGTKFKMFKCLVSGGDYWVLNDHIFPPNDPSSSTWRAVGADGSMDFYNSDWER